MGKVAKIILWLLIIVGITWVGIGVVDSCQSCGAVKPPNEAVYRVEIIANRNILYTSDYTIDGSVYILYGYWEQVKNRYKYRDTELPLDTKTFGKINITKRSSDNAR